MENSRLELGRSYKKKLWYYPYLSSELIPYNVMVEIENQLTMVRELRMLMILLIEERFREAIDCSK